MKKAIFVAAVLAATSAQATSGLDFGDLNYFLKQNQFNLTSDFDVLNQEVNDAEVDGYILRNRFGFGVMDNLNVFLGLDWAYQLDTKVAGQAESRNPGLSNPYIGANYRVMNQKNSALNLDLGLLARVQVLDAELGEDGKDGNFYEGNHTIEANVAVGHKWNEANEWRLTAAALYNFAGEYELRDSNGNNDVETDGSLDFSLTAAYQYRPVQEFMMTTSLEAVRVGEVDAETRNIDVTDDAHLDFNFVFTAKYLITETFIAKFNYGFSRLAEYDRETGATKEEQKDRHENFYGLGIDWLF